MNRICLKGCTTVLFFCLLTLLTAQPAKGAYLFSDQELDDLLAPVALYPDPLLAQILPASTYPEEIVTAAAWLRSGGDPSMIDYQNWAESVRAIARYPDVLYMMASNPDWTADIGDAFIDQQDGVTGSIQRLRWRARDLGNLESTDRQTVLIDDSYIEIIPAQPGYIYVPGYDPTSIYAQRWYPGLTFGLGLAIGEWLSMDFDWNRHAVIYHGWNRPGWVNNARPHVHITNFYIQQSRPQASQAWRHDSAHGDPARYRADRPAGAHSGKTVRPPEVRGRQTAPVPYGGMFGPKGDTGTYGKRGSESRGAPSNSTAPATSLPDAGRRPSNPPHPTAPVTSPPDAGRRPSNPPHPTAPVTSPPDTGRRPSNPPHPTASAIAPPDAGRRPSSPIGSYSGPSEAGTYSSRGRESRGNSGAELRIPPSPAGRPTVPAGGNPYGAKKR